MVPKRVVYLWQIVTGENTVHNVVAGGFDDAMKAVRELRGNDLVTERDVTKTQRVVRIEAIELGEAGSILEK